MKIKNFVWSTKEQLYPFEVLPDGAPLYAVMSGEFTLAGTNNIFTWDLPTSLSNPRNIWKVWGTVCYASGGYAAPLPYVDSNAVYNIGLSIDTGAGSTGRLFGTATTPAGWAGYKARVFLLYYK